MLNMHLYFAKLFSEMIKEGEHKKGRDNIPIELQPFADASPERLIQEHDTWRPHHYASEGQNLLFAARERAGTLPGFVFELGIPAERGVERGFPLRLIQNELENFRFSWTVNSPKTRFPWGT